VCVCVCVCVCVSVCVHACMCVIGAAVENGYGTVICTCEKACNLPFHKNQHVRNVTNDA
jgi:hypothetical protein